MSRRVVMGAAAAVVAVAVTGALAGGLMANGGDGSAASSAETAAATEAPFDFYASADGLLVGTSPRFDEDRELTGGSIALAGSTFGDVTFHSDTYNDVPRPPDPFPVTAGSPVFAVAVLSPECSSTDAVPVLTMTSLSSSGTTHTDAYRPDDPGDFHAALETYCSLGPEVAVTGSSQKPDGSFTVTLRIVNPTATSVEVVSEPLSDELTTWQPAGTTVPSRSTGTLVLQGQGEGCSATNPWTTGKLTLDGVAVEIDQSASEQC